MIRILGSADHSAPQALRPAACPRDPGILNNTKTDCTDEIQTRSRRQAAGCKHLNGKHTLSFRVFLLLTCLMPLIAHADPWFMGPVIITPGEVMPLGSVDWELFFQKSNSTGYYDRNNTFIPVPLVVSKSITSKFTVGVAHDVDFEMDNVYQENTTEDVSSQHLGDTLMLLGFQMLKQGNSHSRPNLKVTLQELFPTGKYDQLTPDLFATDATGGGSYQTSIGFNFSFLSQFSDIHYLKTGASVVLTHPSPSHLHGESTFGGTPQTDGTLYPGDAITFDLATEYSLTQHWVAVMEALFLTQQASVFKGFIGDDPVTTNPNRANRNKLNTLFSLRTNRIRPTRNNIGNGQDIGNGNLAEIDLIPALEYNFTQNLGVMGSIWLTVHGKNTPEFVSGLFVVNFIF